MSVSPLSPERARLLIGDFTRRTVLVVGDVMLDHFVVGAVQRISPEAPVPVVEFQREEYRLGGAANVAHNIVALGARALLIGVTGADEAGVRLAQEAAERGIPTRGLVTDASRRTTTKLRIVTNRNQQVARVDYETDAEISGGSEAEILELAEHAAREADVIVVSDYLKGLVTQTLMKRLGECSQRRGIALLVDPKIPHLSSYAGADLVTPNHQEAEVATRMRIRTIEEARAAARLFQQQVRCASVLITRGEHGMWLLEGSLGSTADAAPEVHSEVALAASAREVADVTGAGDTVLATLALALCAGARLAEAARLANHAAGIVVGRFGAATVQPTELIEATAAADPQIAG